MAHRISRNVVLAVEFATSWLIRHRERGAGYEARQLLGEDSARHSLLARRPCLSTTKGQAICGERSPRLPLLDLRRV